MADAIEIKQLICTEMQNEFRNW